ncbi:MAG: hypothetical protein ACK6DB_06010, partial [Planctomycetota bacterium]
SGGAAAVRRSQSAARCGSAVGQRSARAPLRGRGGRGAGGCRRGVSFATIPAKHWSKDDANQLVARVPRAAWNAWSRGVPTLAIEGNGWRLEGNWEVRAGGEAEPWTKLPLPPRFGGSANIVFPF